MKKILTILIIISSFILSISISSCANPDDLMTIAENLDDNNQHSEYIDDTKEQDNDSPKLTQDALLAQAAIAARILDLNQISDYTNNDSDSSTINTNGQIVTNNEVIDGTNSVNETNILQDLLIQELTKINIDTSNLIFNQEIDSLSTANTTLYVVYAINPNDTNLFYINMSMDLADANNVFIDSSSVINMSNPFSIVQNYYFADTDAPTMPDGFKIGINSQKPLTMFLDFTNSATISGEFLFQYNSSEVYNCDLNITVSIDGNISGTICNIDVNDAIDFLNEYGDEIFDIMNEKE